MRIEKNRRLAVRLAHACAAACIALVLLLSLCLKPDPRGLGTHEQLWLRPCNFHAQFGLPCPTCGMTTAFAHMARGQFADAFIAQPMGALAFVVCIILLPATLAASVSGANLLKIAARLPRKPLLWTLGALFLLAWIFKLALLLTH
jgi:hypothetical protein